MFDLCFHTARRFAVAVSLLAFLAASLTAALPATPAAAQTLALGSRKAFVLIEYQVLDKALFQKLRDEVRTTLKDHGGDLVTREKVDPILGGNPTNISVVGFDSVEAARAWLGSKELAALAPQREKAAKVTTYLVEKLD